MYETFYKTLAPALVSHNKGGRERLSKGLMLADGMLADLGGPRTAGLLDRLDAATPWDQLAVAIKPLYCNDMGKGGRPNVPVVVMLKVTLMQRWFSSATWRWSRQSPRYTTRWSELPFARAAKP